MTEKKNLVFLSQNSSEKESMVIIADSITSDYPKLFIINRENGMPYMLDSSQLNDIRRKHPNTVKPEFGQIMINKWLGCAQFH